MYPELDFACHLWIISSLQYSSIPLPYSFLEASSLMKKLESSTIQKCHTPLERPRYSFQIFQNTMKESDLSWHWTMEKFCLVEKKTSFALFLKIKVGFYIAPWMKLGLELLEFRCPMASTCLEVTSLQTQVNSCQIIQLLGNKVQTFLISSVVWFPLVQTFWRECPCCLWDAITKLEAMPYQKLN